jgi:hypothetical protein
MRRETRFNEGMQQHLITLHSTEFNDITRQKGTEEDKNKLRRKYRRDYQVARPNPSAGASKYGTPFQSAVLVKTELPHQSSAIKKSEWVRNKNQCRNGAIIDKNKTQLTNRTTEG